ncbi:MAG TPA: cytochrome c, partial [Nannocystaceae bacterium]|nr:cytochrome c [Nannocystaceae bacterium]
MSRIGRWKLRRFIKRASVGVAVVVVVIVAVGMAVLYDKGLPTYEVDVAPIEAAPTPARLDRGERLAAMLCRRCHADMRRDVLVGRDLPELAQWGSIHGANLTQDAEHGIGTWSAGELVYVLRTGVQPKTGRMMPPYMIRLPRAADEDLLAIVAFLQSDHPWVAADATIDPPSTPALGVRLRALVDWKPSGMPARPIESPSSIDPVALGRYLVEDLLGCYGCHSPESDGIEPPAEVEHFLAGDRALLDINGKKIASRNLTLDLDAGIGRWTYPEFRRALVDGFRPDGTLVRWPMRRHQQLQEHEVEAIFAYLQQVRADPTKPRASEPYKIVGPRADPGAHVFHKHGCHYCHGENGSGLAHASADFASDAEM